MRVASIHVYPVKATAPVTVPSAVVELAGLRHDRRWAVIDQQGHRLNATTHAGLLTVTATPGESADLTVTRPRSEPLVVPPPREGAEIAVDVSRLATMVDAGDAGDDAARWFTDLLGQSVRLAWQDDPGRRTIAPEHGGLGSEPLSLADAGPVLVTTTASLERLEAWMADEREPQTIAMGRFRPNVVVEDAVEPFVEDTWRSIRIGGVEYRFAEHCDRCGVTTIDPATLERGKEPIRTLARHRRWDGKTWFGIRIVPIKTGTIAVGDEVVVGT